MQVQLGFYPKTETSQQERLHEVHENGTEPNENGTEPEKEMSPLQFIM